MEFVLSFCVYSIFVNFSNAMLVWLWVDVRFVLFFCVFTILHKIDDAIAMELYYYMNALCIKSSPSAWRDAMKNWIWWTLYQIGLEPLSQPPSRKCILCIFLFVNQYKFERADKHRFRSILCEVNCFFFPKQLQRKSRGCSSQNSTYFRKFFSQIRLVNLVISIARSFD